MRVAIQGEFGSFSHQAAINMAPGADIVPCAFSAEVFERISEHDMVAVIPIENSLAGPVAEHFDLLFHNDVQIEAEALLRIRHNLIGVPGVALKQVGQVFSHPVALAQCRRFFLQHPALSATPAYDTAGSVKLLLERADCNAAAIASIHAARYYGGEVLAAGIEDNPANFTRFFLIRAREGGKPPIDFDKVSVAFIIENHPGSLVTALQAFAQGHANLSKIESRPVQGKPWEYVFYVDYQVAQPQAADSILEDLSRRCLTVKELGRYQAARETFE